MARKKKSKTVTLAGVRIRKSLAKSALKAAQTPLGKVLVAEALLLAGGLLARTQPAANAAAAGAEAVGAATDAAGSATHTAAKFMHAAADRLKASAGLDNGRARRKQGRMDGMAARDDRDGGEANPDLIHQALLGDYRKKKGKKAKSAKRH